MTTTHQASHKAHNLVIWYSDVAFFTAMRRAVLKKLTDHHSRFGASA
jgi:hypothetical protein